MGMGEGRYQRDVRVLWINKDAPNVLRITQANVGPRFSAVGGFVNPIAVGEIGTQIGFAGTDIDNVGLRLTDCNRANQANGRPAENRPPRFPAVRRLPAAAAN